MAKFIFISIIGRLCGGIMASWAVYSEQNKKIFLKNTNILLFQKSALAGWGDSKAGGGAGAGTGAGVSGGTQGLAHWMSVMAEHMNPESSLHHPYMWPNGIEQKMSLTEQQHLLHKGCYLFQ